MLSRSLCKKHLLSSLLFLYSTTTTTRAQLDFSDGFPCTDSGISLNPGPRAFPRLIPNEDNDQCTLRMSPDQVARGVSAFIPYTFANDPNYAFETSFTYQLSGVMNGQGDGIAFVMHQDIRGVWALGSEGGNLGVYGSGIINPAIVVELDSYKNEFGLPADEYDAAVHVTIVNGFGQIIEVGESPTSIRGQTFTVDIRCDGQFIQVRVNGILRVTGCVKPSDYFLGPEVFVGFTAGTGNVADQQDIFSWTFADATPFVSITSCPDRPIEVRPPTRAPVPTPPVPAPQPVTPVPTNAPIAAPSSSPSIEPTTQEAQLFNFWVWLVQIIEVLAEYLAALATVPNDP